jgi:fructoselysine-6-P-deglycase FrlB-like protein
LLEEMIEAEAGLPRAVAARTDDAAEIARAVADAHERGERIVVTGCGTSEHAAQGIAALLAEQLGAAAVAARQALDAASAPERGGVCIGVSHEGGTAATVAALTAARASGAGTVLVTAAPTAPAAEQADLVLATPLVDRSWCHTVGYVSPLLAGALVAAALAGQPFSAQDAERALAAAGERVGVSALARSRRLLVAGSGVDEVTARELALKVAEGARLPSQALSLENVLHGHLVAEDAESAVVVVVTGDASTLAARRAPQVLEAARRIGAATAALASAGIADELDAELRLVLPDVPGALGRLLGGAGALQSLTVALVRARGVNPDLLRREEPPYRSAAAAAEEGAASVYAVRGAE